MCANLGNHDFLTFVYRDWPLDGTFICVCTFSRFELVYLLIYLIDQENKHFKVQLQQGHGWFCSNLLAAVPLLVHSLGPPQVGKLFNSQVKPYFYQHLPDNLSGEEEPTPSMENNLCPPL